MSVGISAEDETYYGEFTTPREREVLDVPRRLVEAWSTNDADRAAGVFTEEGVLVLPGPVFRAGRGEIRSYLADEFNGRLRGSSLVGRPVDVRFATDDLALVRTHGGIVPAADAGPGLPARVTWSVVRRDGTWRLAAYHATPSGDGTTVGW